MHTPKYGELLYSIFLQLEYISIDVEDVKQLFIEFEDYKKIREKIDGMHYSARLLLKNIEELYTLFK